MRRGMVSPHIARALRAVYPPSRAMIVLYFDYLSEQSMYPSAYSSIGLSTDLDMFPDDLIDSDVHDSAL